ncbi:MAG: hypothetical protein C0421_13425 [Hyphomonas sp.]|nr:hypothetical protein [Hyphomonas sp.]
MDEHHCCAAGHGEQHLPGLARAVARAVEGGGERAEDTDRDQGFLDEEGVGGVPVTGAGAEHGAEGENCQCGEEGRAEPDGAGRQHAGDEEGGQRRRRGGAKFPGDPAREAERAHQGEAGGQHVESVARREAAQAFGAGKSGESERETRARIRHQRDGSGGHGERAKDQQYVDDQPAALVGQGEGFEPCGFGGGQRAGFLKGGKVKADDAHGANS